MTLIQLRESLHRESKNIVWHKNEGSHIDNYFNTKAVMLFLADLLYLCAEPFSDIFIQRKKGLDGLSTNWLY